MTDSDDAKKWNAIYEKNEFAFYPPCKVLHQNIHLLPKTGSALDLACGTGRNAIALAKQSLDTTAIDVSEVAISKLLNYATTENLKINALASDLNKEPLNYKYDVIVVSHYLNRNIIPNIKSALNENGLIFYQTFIKNKVDDIGPSNPDYLLDQNELLELFKEYEVLLYREEGIVGDIEQGFRNEAMIVVKK